MNGTSMAAPLVAGLLGVLRSLDPSLTAEDAYALIHETGADTPDAALTGRQIRADQAIRRVLGKPAPSSSEQAAIR
jgi:thermitase